MFAATFLRIPYVPYGLDGLVKVELLSIPGKGKLSGSHAIMFEKNERLVWEGEVFSSYISRYSQRESPSCVYQTGSFWI